MTLEELADVATVAGGAAAVVGLVFAMWQVVVWKRQRRSEMRSEAAARALIALTRAHDALVAWATALEDITDVEDPAMDVVELIERFEQLDRSGREASEQPLRELHAAIAEAYVHLDNKEAGFLSNVHSIALEMRENIDSSVTEVECVPSGEELASIQRLRHGVTEGRAFIAEQLQNAAVVLQPIARLTK